MYYLYREKKKPLVLAIDEAQYLNYNILDKQVHEARQRITSAGLNPYYLYRQAGSLSSLENVGYAKPGTEGLYNIYIMDDSHTVLAVGAGGSTKLCRRSDDRIERVFNYKYPYEYIERFDTVRARKEKIRQFYGRG